MKKAGFSLLEVLVAVAIISIFIPAIAQLLYSGLRSTTQGQAYSKAYMLAEQAMEAVFYLKANDKNQWDWISKPVNTSENQYYQLTKVAGKWQLGTITENPVEDTNSYTTTVQIFPVRRDSNGSITEDETSPVDVTTRFIKVKVTFDDQHDRSSIEEYAYVSQH